jgi:hypothetical protein
MAYRESLTMAFCRIAQASQTVQLGAGANYEISPI